MKKFFCFFLSMFILPVFSETVNDFTNICAVQGYKRLYATFSANQYTCLPGNFLPADAIECAACPNGYTCSGGTYYYNATDAQGLTKNSQNAYSDAQNACAINTIPKRLYAILTPYTYNCQSGQFLPANSTECATCPSGTTCSGGDYPFNTKEAQGLIRTSPYVFTEENNTCATNQVKVANAVYTINTYNCSVGYYLPANIDECRKCLNDHYCPGGTYTFNETIDQGMNDCPSAHPFAPAGMWQQSQCGRKLHVGDDILYMHQQPAHPTIHRLYIGHPNGIYSANAIQRDMNSNTFPKMSEGMSKGLHVMIGDVEYLICDDSVPECRND